VFQPVPGLASVTPCDGSNVCLPSIKLAAQNGSGGIAKTNNAKLTEDENWLSNFAVYPGDFNGDALPTSSCPALPAPTSAQAGIATANNCVQVQTGNWKDTYKIYTGDFNVTE